ncbi:prephenate dehydratase [Rhodococcus chondri]|uniref:Prephenate dehydratase n=1 Tax=Rhodococcus chondri TaxID=3065941 RepID=A0ABU7JL29_9NOCA|nr:prephenate dehydratase [Rhodococcus sp. CC-R104]MEE2030738.1 prephenate dehydratase [Rhodococcus sp. CC-R104]
MPRIAYFGPTGTFTEMALARFEELGIFDEPVERVSATNPPAALQLLRDGEVTGAVVPIESSVEGSVPPTMDALALGPRLQILAEIELDVAFTVVARPGTTLGQVRTVGAYPVAGAQVRQWLAEHLPAAEVVASSSNAGAAEDVASGKVDAGVSTALAGRRLGLDALADGVADFAGARTRFVLVGRPAPVPERTGCDRTSVILQLPNEPGSLVRAMTEFATRGIDLTRIESRPTRREYGTYFFHLDCVGHVDDALVAEALKALHRFAHVRFLGSWAAVSEHGVPPVSDDDDEKWLQQLRRGEEQS